jgi:ABC-type antimicrobial peptide transport system permease subunit
MGYLAALPEVAHIANQVSAAAVLEVLDTREAALLCGIDGDSYFDAFPGIELEEGRFLVSGEFGAMVTAEKALSLEKRSGQKLKIGEMLVFTSAGETGFKIREAPLVGIYRYTNPTAYLNEVILADAQTVRVLSSIQIATSDVEVDEDAVSLLGQGTALDDLFGGGSFFGNEDDSLFGSIDGEPDETSVDNGLNLMEELSGLLAGNSGQNNNDNAANAEGGDWNFIVLRLSPNVNADMLIAKIKDVLAEYGAMAVGWRFAAGSSAIIALLIQMLFNAGILLVSIACVLAVVNILLIAVFRRTKEIGTLRAIGARDRSIRMLILLENGTLGILAGITGVLFGFLLLAVINAAQIELPNELLSSILGGEILNIAFSPVLALLSVLVALTLSVVSSLYPVEMAVKIAPIVAVQNG